MKGHAGRGNKLSHGEYGLKALGRGWMSSNQIEAARRAMTRTLKRGGKVWIRVFPDKPVTAKPAGVRMGGGKGDIDRYVVVIKPGRVLFEIAGASEDLVMSALRKASHKLPFKTKVISKKG